MTKKEEFERGVTLEIVFLGSVSSVENFSKPAEWSVAGLLVDEDDEAYYIDAPQTNDEEDNDIIYRFHTILKSSVIDIYEVKKRECH